ncbi:hypothetical protein B0H13DRAFT_892548 [Mycena leptocephala]|nr:hypothetical protein B0H13DRAFT_892548 [Mycena leptocephala]
MSALEADRARVADLAAQILHLEHSLAALRAEKALAEKIIDAYKYPVLTLPNEITSEIFLHFLPKYPRCPRLTGILSPNLLTQICRTWREIALGTPALWRAIAFLDERNYISFERQADIGDVWLSRSRRCPLSVYVNEDSEGDTVLDSVLEAVVPHRERWECLKLCLALSLPPTLAGPMPLLRHLDFKVLDFVDPANVVKVVLLELPLLRTAILNDNAASSVVLPWAQLTSLTLTRVLPQEWIPILKQTFNLVHCDLRLYPIYGQSQEIPEITLPRLESLTLTGTELDTGIRLSQYCTFIFPALRRLQVSEEFLRESPIDALALFISRSSCRLETVCITGERMSITKDSFLAAFPAISKLTFPDQYPDGVYEDLDLSDDE